MSKATIKRSLMGIESGVFEWFDATVTLAMLAENFLFFGQKNRALTGAVGNTFGFVVD